MPFSGFGPQAVPFFKALAFHQTKEWFEANRAIYEGDVKAPLGDLVEDLAARFAKLEIPLKGDRKTSVFRIYRDVRFAKDKSPYKTNAGAALTRSGGEERPRRALCPHRGDGCFAAAGFHMPEPPALARLRASIKRSPKAWRAMVAKLAKGDLDARRRKRHQARAARLRGHRRSRNRRRRAQHLIHLLAPIADARLAQPGLVDDVVAFARDALPLLEWGWSAVVDERE